MRKIFTVFLAIMTFSLHALRAQKASAWSWVGEIHAGWQAELNSYPYSAQLKQGAENKSYDSSIHYSEYFRSQVPVIASVGIQNSKGYSFQVNMGYYGRKMALSNPPDVQGNEDYLLGSQRLALFQLHAMLDYATISGRNNCPVHLLGGIWTGMIVPLSVCLDESTLKHFGIASLQQRVEWNAGGELELNISLGKKLFLTNNLSFGVSFAGNGGQIALLPSSSYTPGNAVKTDQFALTTGLGFRF